MKYWVISDTHFGHEKCKDWCGRPGGFENKILKHLSSFVEPEDVLIHLGDVAFHNEAWWHEKFHDLTHGKHWLVKGNHDKRSDKWYLEHGWDFVGNRIEIKRNGLYILFSHKPIADNGYDINIHGHFHNSDYRRHEPELASIENPKQLLVKCEHDYCAYSLDKLVRKWLKK